MQLTARSLGEWPITPDHDSDIHVVCDLVKSWFKLLPEPVFPSSSYFNVIEAMSKTHSTIVFSMLIELENLNSRLACIRSVVRLPQANFEESPNILIGEFLCLVADYEECNQMTAEVLAIVFGPNLLLAPQNDFALVLSNMGHTRKLVKALITHVRDVTPFIVSSPMLAAVPCNL
ncbi:Rho GTPase activation protein [Suillus subalutaceus]|uniref:Rho GTPase activation protein n=1 Tax=Suillus subalutaceus TaxID=48586 RepID=UPI001B86C3F8|nr:Rho GTPase activation protein [Suillus subalutaceus]KAG1863216.1 Rho GTPase activation protein [Suillus subalutaceus]